MFNSELKDKAINKLKEAQKDYELTLEKTKSSATNLVIVRKTAVLKIKEVEKYLNTISNIPIDIKKDVAAVLYSIGNFIKAVVIEDKDFENQIKAGGIAVAGGTAAASTILLGGSAAMAFATTFGTASTGVAISALSGAAATNAALAWLGGGAIAAGGGGMAAGGSLIATITGPVGWVIGGIGIAASLGYKAYKNSEAAELAEKEYSKAQECIFELKRCIFKIKGLEDKTKQLISKISTNIFTDFPKDFDLWNDDQANTLITVINSTKALGELINEKI